MFCNAPYGIYYWYDSLGQLIRVDDQLNNTSTEYVYDASGNLLYYTDAEYSQDELTNIFGATQFEYTDSEWGDLLTSYNGHSITYDALGNPLSYYNTRAYTFTWSGREMRSATVGGKTYSFTYDESGMRHTKTVSGATTTYYYNGSLLVAECNSSETIIYIYDASGLPIGMQYHANTYAEDEWDVYWFERSMLGDIIAVYASDGTKLIGYRYDAWGVFWVSYYNGGQNTSATKNSFGYRGYYYDKDLRMYYLASRYYDTRIMRFISPDSYVSTGVGLIGYNMYAYCNNSPVSMIDPLGNAPITIGVGIVIAVLAIGTVGGAILGLMLDEKIIDNKDNVDGMVSLPESHSNTDGNNYNSSELPSEFSNETNGSLAPPNTGDYGLALEDRVINSAIMASYGLAASGAVLIIGAIILPAKAFVGITTIQVFAIGCLAYNVSAMITAPLMGIEMEALEMN